MKKTTVLMMNLLLITSLFADVPRVPAWAKGAVWYQVFPERFRNGDPSNDPDSASMEGTWPYNVPEKWQIIFWGDQWYKMQSWETTDQHKQLRRYGGDIQGIIDQLDYLNELGITALYLNPVFESPSLHKYGCSMYHHIDNNFGPDPAKDIEIWLQETPEDPATWQWTTADKLFLKLIDECHKRDMKIIIDGVFNHTGIPFWAFQDIKENGKESEYVDWFVVKSFDDPDTPEDEFDWDGWYGVKDLPEIFEDNQGPKEGFRHHIKAIVERWGDPNGDGDPGDGIDGWRLDVAEKVDLDFWKDFRKWVKAVNPNAYIVGEVWWEAFEKGKMFNAAPWLEGDAFDAVMNYRFGDAMLKAFVDQEWHAKPSELDQLLGFMRENYHPENQYVLFNLMGSHDTERFASQLINPDRLIDHGANMQWEIGFDTRKPEQDDYEIQKLITVFQNTYPGGSFIYYGDEVGMWGADDPDCRKPMVWSDISYENETINYEGNPQPEDIVEVNRDLLDFYKKIIALRNNNLCLKTGDFKLIIADDDLELYGFDRTWNGKSIRSIFHLAEGEVKIPKNLVKKWRPVLSLKGNKKSISGKGCLIMKK